jgi:uncharacterized protein (DUF2147 family)
MSVRKLLVAFAAGLAAMSGLTAGVADAAGPGQAAGVWRNPKNTVHVRMQSCGDTVCGTIIWADARAQQKAREAGTARLIGTQLFREFRQTGPGEWSGRVFVPTIGRTFSGSMKAEGRNAITGRGCLIGRFLCKTQTWTRIS